MRHGIETFLPIASDPFAPFNIERAQNWFEHWESFAPEIIFSEIGFNIEKARSRECFYSVATTCVDFFRPLAKPLRRTVKKGQTIGTKRMKL